MRRVERKAKQFKRVHELSKTVGVQRAVKAVGVSRYGYYKWLDRNDLEPISRFQRINNDEQGTDNMRL